MKSSRAATRVTGLRVNSAPIKETGQSPKKGEVTKIARYTGEACVIAVGIASSNIESSAVCTAASAAATVSAVQADFHVEAK